MSTGLHLNMQGYRDTCLYTELNALTCKITKFIYTKTQSKDVYRMAGAILWVTLLKSSNVFDEFLQGLPVEELHEFLKSFS